MSNLNRRVTTTTFRQDQQTSPPNATRPAIHFDNSSSAQVPTPEPRKKLSTKTNTYELTKHEARSLKENKNDNEHQMKQFQHQIRQQAGNLVKETSQQHREKSPQNPRAAKQPEIIVRKGSSFNGTRPIELVADEGVGSPTNIDYDDEEEIADEYYDDEEEEEEYETSEQADELTNLSRQSMMPLHELIAYYQYIQQGGANTQIPNHRQTSGAVSRQSSSASQQTTRTKHSFNTEEDTTDAGQRSTSECVSTPDESDKPKTKVLGDEVDEPQLSKINIPKVLVDNVDEKTPNDELKESQQQASLPQKDKRRIRANIILELINSERDFVKHLRDVVEGYLHPARRHPEIFTGERINTIFSNIEQLYEFQRTFLEKLETCINWDDLAQSEVGNCFIEFENGFSVYHYYCNNHPNATSELQELYTKPRFVKFFEACRLLQNMIDISLDGFLLTPIQKICKYPLQLTELLKNTDEHHSDFKAVANALESMRNCANLANERKRRIEALADVMSFQEKVENWFGPKLSDTSSILIHSGEVAKMTSHTWSQGVQLYLFDHLLLYSKKDLLKRNSLILKGRICMDSVTEISDADEYKAKKSFKIHCSEQQKWFVFTTKSEKEKDEWIKAFERERNLVESDENEGFHITEREIGVARRALQNRKFSRSARYRHKRPDTAVVDQLDLDDANLIMNRTLSLPSCIHPSHVMNFVEDSKVVSNRKKSSSPNSSSRSPTMLSNQILAEQENHQQQQSSASNWFRRMGSKKLARSQVYNVNGAGSGVSSHSLKPLPASPTAIVMESSSALATNYDQLEKRHRNHMVSEEQARLFRLNNDLPPQIFASSNCLPQSTKNTNNNHLKHSNSALNQQSQHTSRGGIVAASIKRFQSPEATSPSELNFRSLNLSPTEPQHQNNTNLRQETGYSSRRGSERQSTKTTNTTFETTLVLSSGRIVTVREDAV